MLRPLKTEQPSDWSPDDALKSNRILLPERSWSTAALMKVSSTNGKPMSRNTPRSCPPSKISKPCLPKMPKPSSKLPTTAVSTEIMAGRISAENKYPVINARKIKNAATASSKPARSVTMVPEIPIQRQMCVVQTAHFPDAETKSSTAKRASSVMMDHPMATNPITADPHVNSLPAATGLSIQATAKPAMKARAIQIRQPTIAAPPASLPAAETESKMRTRDVMTATAAMETVAPSPAKWRHNGVLPLSPPFQP